MDQKQGMIPEKGFIHREKNNIQQQGFTPNNNKKQPPKQRWSLSPHFPRDTNKARWSPLTRPVNILMQDGQVQGWNHGAVLADRRPLRRELLAHTQGIVLLVLVNVQKAHLDALGLVVVIDVIFLPCLLVAVWIGAGSSRCLAPLVRPEAPTGDHYGRFFQQFR